MLQLSHLNHLKVHGKDITVGILGFYTDEKRCNESALKFSKDNNIVESDDWANLIEETGLMTGVSMKGENNPFYGKIHHEETKIKMSEKAKGENNPNYGNKLAANHMNVKITCEHCNKTVSKGNYYRWHNINCKSIK